MSPHGALFSHARCARHWPVRKLDIHLEETKLNGSDMNELTEDPQKAQQSAISPYREPCDTSFGSQLGCDWACWSINSGTGARITTSAAAEGTQLRNSPCVEEIASNVAQSTGLSLSGTCHQPTGARRRTRNPRLRGPRREQ